MRHHLFVQASTPEDAHAILGELAQHLSDYAFHTLANGWVAVRARLRHEDAVDELEAAGVVVWDHITDHTARLEDRHHVGVVPAEAGIVTGDTPLVAARKLYEHLGRHRPFRPTIGVY